jgi:nicotinamide-nucleotide amidase
MMVYRMSSTEIEKEVGELLLKKKLTVSVAESCTGGLISSKLTDVSGSSAYITLNVVTYANDAKVKILGVPDELIQKHGAVSEPVAKAMTEGIRRLAGSDIGLGTTGIAGPTGGTPEKPVGLVYIGVADKNGTEVYKVNINPDLPRTEIKAAACNHALALLLAKIKNLSNA